MAIISPNPKAYPVWLAIDSSGEKVIVAQEQDHAVRSFKSHYKRDPSLVMNAVYYTKETKPA